MSGDLLFPLPDPGPFLPYVNCVIVWRQSLVEPTTDVNGAIVYPAGPSVVISQTYVAMVDQAEIDSGNANLENVNIVVLMRNDSPVSHADEITVLGVNQYLDGRYVVNAVRPNPSHLRVLARRMGDINDPPTSPTSPSPLYPSPNLLPSPTVYPGA
jgi:hypothetical protein